MFRSNGWIGQSDQALFPIKCSPKEGHKYFCYMELTVFFSSTFYTGYLIFRKITSRVAHHKVIKSCIPLVIIIYSLPFSFQISNPGLQMRQLQDPQKPNGNLLLSSCTFDHVMNHPKNKIFFSWFGSQNFSVTTFFLSVV